MVFQTHNAVTAIPSLKAVVLLSEPGWPAMSRGVTVCSPALHITTVIHYNSSIASVGELLLRVAFPAAL
jgi:hypothetical protein